jgi:hypothetical protein
MRRQFTLVILLLMLYNGCVEPFDIQDISTTDVLVIEGLLSTQYKRHRVSVSRTSSLNDRRFIPESGAEVRIESSDGDEITLTEESPGNYETAETTGEAGKTYTLFVTTHDGRQYASHEVTLTSGPEIASITANYSPQNDQGDGIQIAVNTEDPTGNARYYRWNYVETYQVQAPFPSNYIWLGGNNVIFRTHGIDTCWVTDSLKTILIKSTEGLEQDKVTAYPLRFIPGYSHIMLYKYSLLVQQFILTEQGYEYWNNLRIMNQNQGSLSDVQPGVLPGNIFSLTNERETVLGYFEACTVSEKRVFFTPDNFYSQGYALPKGIRSSCRELLPISAPELEIGKYMETYSKEMLIRDSYGFSPFAVFELMPRFCCDCTDLGPNIKPSFWQ